MNWCLKRTLILQMQEREAMDEEVCGPRSQRQRLGYQPEMKEPPRRGRTERVTEKASHNPDDSVRLENKPPPPPPPAPHNFMGDNKFSCALNHLSLLLLIMSPKIGNQLLPQRFGTWWMQMRDFLIAQLAKNLPAMKETRF